MSNVEFRLRITLVDTGEDNDAIYQWLTNKLYEIDDVVEVSELPDE